jgi:hypothetical protein
MGRAEEVRQHVEILSSCTPPNHVELRIFQRPAYCIFEAVMDGSKSVTRVRQRGIIGRRRSLERKEHQR